MTITTIITDAPVWNLPANTAIDLTHHDATTMLGTTETRRFLIPRENVKNVIGMGLARVVCTMRVPDIN